MKLLRLKLHSDFRSLKAGFEINFRQLPLKDESSLKSFQPFCFAGLNGSGKSNVLEALANIFYHLELCAVRFLPKEFKEQFDDKHALVEAYELEYLLSPFAIPVTTNEDYDLIKVKKESGQSPEMQLFSRKETDGDLTDSYVAIYMHSMEDRVKKFKAGKINKDFLPDLMVGYSSGENEILSLPFIKTRLIHYDEYLEAIHQNFAYKEPESSLLYIDNEMSQAVLLANLLFYGDKVLEPLRKELGIVGLSRFRMHLNNHEVKGKDEKGKETAYKILDQLAPQLEKLKQCATSWNEYENEQGQRSLCLDFFIDQDKTEVDEIILGAMKQAFRHHFKDAFELFRVFQILYTLNHRTVDESTKKAVYASEGYYTEGKIPQPGPNDKVFYFLDYFILKEVEEGQAPKELLLRNFSDGEHQFLHTMGICLMLENKRSLLLLDEPETHFNPDWRSKFINVLHNSIEAGGGNNLLKEVLLTSHSPFIISDCLPNNVIVFRKENNETKALNARQMGFNTYGSSVEIILQELFNRDQSIGDKANNELESIDFSKIQTEEDIRKIKAFLNHLGDSIEKDLVLARLNQISSN